MITAQEIHEYISKLIAEPCLKNMNVGSRVLIASGCCGGGHLHSREEGVITEIADECVKVRVKGRSDKWLIKPLVVDVLPPRTVDEVNDDGC